MKPPVVDLDRNHGVLHQFSLSTAIVEGVHSGATTIGEIRKHGDLGLGTYENLDGEIVAIDGQFYQVTSEGNVRLMDDSAPSPFATVTRFAAGLEKRQGPCRDLEELSSICDGLRRSQNIFYAFRITGTFEAIHARSMCRASPGISLVQASTTQREFKFRKVSGSIVGFWTPSYATTLSIPGYHLHFLSDDHKSGGHILNVTGGLVTIQAQELYELHVTLPKTEEFLKADLTRDPSKDLARAEGGRG